MDPSPELNQLATAALIAQAVVIVGVALIVALDRLPRHPPRPAPPLWAARIRGGGLLVALSLTAICAAAVHYNLLLFGIAPTRLFLYAGVPALTVAAVSALAALLWPRVPTRSRSVSAR